MDSDALCGVLHQLTRLTNKIKRKAKRQGKRTLNSKGKNHLSTI